MRPVPILFLGDSPDLNTGLARIGRDLAVLLSQNPRFKVGYLGLGGNGSMQLPFQQYVMQATPEKYEWGYFSLPRVWQDFSQGQDGIIFTVWDLSRILWLARPAYVEDPALKNFLLTGNFKLWSYLPIDAEGPNGKLTGMAVETMLGIDRLLCYTPWARDLVAASMGPDEALRKGLDWIPHGLDGDIWTPGGQKEKVIGVVASNQPRKDWGLVARVCSLLKQRIPDLRFWWHVDKLVSHWSIPALLHDYGIVNDTEVTLNLSNRDMVDRYRSCLLTLAPGLGEGFGYPIFESLACGTPVLHGNYAGGASILKTMGLGTGKYVVQPIQWRPEGQFNCERPVFDPEEWTSHAEMILEEPGDPQYYAGRVEHLFWKNLWPVWEKWFNAGVTYQ